QANEFHRSKRLTWILGLRTIATEARRRQWIGHVAAGGRHLAIFTDHDFVAFVDIATDDFRDRRSEIADAGLNVDGTKLVGFRNNHPEPPGVGRSSIFLFAATR